MPFRKGVELRLSLSEFFVGPFRFMHPVCSAVYDRGSPGIQRKQDMLGAFISGDLNATKTLNGQKAILGMDVFIYEHRQKTEKGEWHVNVYDYVITRTRRIDFPFCLHGPFTKEALVGHWPECLDLSPY